MFRRKVGLQLDLVFGIVRVRLLVGHWQVLENILDVRLEAHVDHLVGLQRKCTDINISRQANERRK